MVFNQDRGGLISTPVKVFVVGVIVGVLILFSKRLSTNSETGKVVNINAFNKVQNVLRKYKADPLFKSLVDKHSIKLAMSDASDFLLAQIAQENTPVDPMAEGDNGKSRGLLQVQEDVAKAYGYTFDSMFDVNSNLDVATKYLKFRYGQTGDWHTALRRYNGGGKGENIAQTKVYADSIMENLIAIKAFK